MLRGGSYNHRPICQRSSSQGSVVKPILSSFHFLSLRFSLSLWFSVKRFCVWELAFLLLFVLLLRAILGTNQLPNQLDRLTVDNRRFFNCPFHFSRVRNGNPSWQRGGANQLIQTSFPCVPKPGEEEDQPKSGWVRSDLIDQVDPSWSNFTN